MPYRLLASVKMRDSVQSFCAGSMTLFYVYIRRWKKVKIVECGISEWDVFLHLQSLDRIV